MKRPTIAIVLLGLAFVASNLWWCFAVIDSGITASYRQEDLDRHHKALRQALAVAPLQLAARRRLNRFSGLHARLQVAILG